MAIMDLYGRKIVGMAVSEHNDKELVISALKDTGNRIEKNILKDVFYTLTEVRRTHQRNTLI